MASKPELHSTARVQEHAVLVAIIDDKQTARKTEEYLDELEFLATTNNIVTLKKFTQRLSRPDHGTYVGKGKLEEIRLFIEENKVDYAIFDDDLTPSQVRNLERELKCFIFDRSLLIIEIFQQRAQTAQARTQVELAKNQYILPRLTRMWTHLERQRGGTGTRGGSGEQEIETDKRIIRDKISLLKDKLEKIDKQSATQRKSRSLMVRVALVGYTNVGKSTIMNMISKSDVFAENKLFATVDATVRKVVLEKIPFLLSDTVGFIRKLPTRLIESFKSTLDEVREADILVHVVDISHPSFEEHIMVVNQTLGEIKASDKPTIIVFNKIDRLAEMPDDQRFATNIEELKNTYLNDRNEVVFISANKKENIAELYSKLMHLVKERHFQIFPNYIIPE
ncbi:MAG: GTPase HflX [Cytophagales bacterium]|nr:GTPase HflX [Cytophagales bacterium]